MSPTPRLSVVVVAYDMPVQLPRTLVSLSPGYQQNIASGEYEVIVVDNGSTPPVEVGSAVGDNVRIVRIDDASPSPAQAVNVGLGLARGDVIGVMVDGARLVSPGLLQFALAGASLYPKPVVASMGWVLGGDTSQATAIRTGYDLDREEALLQSIDWPSDGYRLYEVSAPAGTSIDGWFQPIDETNALFLRRETWQELGGVDERFDLPSGGFVNLDLFRRALELPGARFVMLLGEGTFHQLHGDLPTRGSPAVVPARVAALRAQYEQIAGRAWATPVPSGLRTYIGTLPQRVLSHLVRAAMHPVSGAPSPLGAGFDVSLWGPDGEVACSDPVARELIQLVRGEFRAQRYAAAAAVARLTRRVAPDHPEVLRLLSYTSAWLRPTGVPPAQAAAVHAALGDAQRLLGDDEAATAEYRAALALNPGEARATLGLSSLPGPRGDKAP